MGRRNGPQARGRKAGTYFGGLGPALGLALASVLNPTALSAGQENPRSEIDALPPGY